MAAGADDESMSVEREPERFGPYEVVRHVGGGGFAETLLAREFGPDGFALDVCIKRVRKEHAGDPEFEGPLRDEAVMMAAISNPFIVGVRGFSRIQGRPVLVLEYVDGTSLGKVLRHFQSLGRPMQVPMALNVMGRVLEALDSAHRLVLNGQDQRLIHRDINPNNILLDRAGYPKLIDFGLVKAKDRTYQTEEGKIRGTLAYMAPEQILTQATGISEDARVDIYAVGIVLHELLSGAHPFRKAGVTDYEIINLVVKGTKPSLSKVAKDLPAGLAEIVDRMTAKKAEDRPSTALEVLELLAPYMPADLRPRRELAEIVNQIAGPQRSLGGLVPRDVDTATRVRDREPVPSSGVKSRPPVQGTSAEAGIATPLPSPLPPHTTHTRVVAAASKSQLSPGPKRWLALSLTVAVAVLAIGLGLRDRSKDGEAPITAVVETNAVAPRAAAPASPGKTTPSPAVPRTDAPGAPTSAGPESSPPPSSTAHDLGGIEPLAKVPSVEDAAKPTAMSPIPKSPTSAGKPAERESAAAERNAWLDVSVSPKDRTWQVWVDGQYYGTADVKVKVVPGKHKVEVGTEKPSVARSVRVAPRTTRPVAFEF